MERGKWEVLVVKLLFSEEEEKVMEVKLQEERMRRRQACMAAPGCIATISINTIGL